MYRNWAYCRVPLFAFERSLQRNDVLDVFPFEIISGWLAPPAEKGFVVVVSTATRDRSSRLAPVTDDFKEVHSLLRTGHFTHQYHCPTCRRNVDGVQRKRVEEVTDYRSTQFRPLEPDHGREALGEKGKR